MSLTILIPRTPDDDALIDRLQNYLSANILQPFGVARLSTEANEIFLHRVDGTQRFPTLSGLLNAIDGCDLVRLIVTSISSQPDDARFADFVQECHDELESVTRDTDVTYFQGGLFSCMPDETLPSTIVGNHNRYFNFNLVVVPEDHIGERDAPRALISEYEGLHEVMASMVALVGGLWVWLNGGPLDEFESRHDEHRDRIRLARATTRMTSTEDISVDRILDQLEGRTVGGLLQRVPPSGCRAHPDASLAVSQLHQKLISDRGGSPIGFSYRDYSAVHGRSSGTRELNIVDAMKLFASELKTELAAMPSELFNRFKNMLLRMIRAREQQVMNLTWGPDSSIVLDILNSNDLEKVSLHRARYRELQAHLGTMKAFDATRIPTSASSWQHLFSVVVAAADGSPVDQKLLPDGLSSESHGQRVVDVDNVGSLASRKYVDDSSDSEFQVDFDKEDLKKLGFSSDSTVRVVRHDVRMVDRLLSAAKAKGIARNPETE